MSELLLDAAGRPALTRHAAGVPRRPAAAQQGDALPSRPTHGRPGRDWLGLGIGVVGLAIAAAATARVSDASDWAFDLLLLSGAWGWAGWSAAGISK